MEPANGHKLARAALGAALLIPVGLAVIFTSIGELSQANQQPGDLIQELLIAAQALAPWCQSLLCLLFGLALLSTPIVLLARGLQS